LQGRRAQRDIQTFEKAAHAIYEMHKPIWKNQKHTS